MTESHPAPARKCQGSLADVETEAHSSEGLTVVAQLSDFIQNGKLSTLTKWQQHLPEATCVCGNHVRHGQSKPFLVATLCNLKKVCPQYQRRETPHPVYPAALLSAHVVILPLCLCPRGYEGARLCFPPS